MRCYKCRLHSMHLYHITGRDASNNAHILQLGLAMISKNRDISLEAPAVRIGLLLAEASSFDSLLAAFCNSAPVTPSSTWQPDVISDAAKLPVCFQGGG